MPSRVPLTNLRDSNKGGAPLYLGGDRLAGESVATPPGFLDDNDQYFEVNYARRGLVSIAHIPPAGASTVDFVTMFLRNMSTSERAYANILLAADLAMEMRISGVQASSPVYGDVLLVDADGEAELVATVDPVTNALTIEVTSSGIFDASLNPVIEFDPPVEGNLSAAPVLSATGAVTSVTVINPTSHGFTAAPVVRVRGGVLRRLGFFEASDADTTVAASTQAGTLSLIGTLCRTEFASNVSQPGDVLLVNNEVRVVQSVNPDTREFTIDHALSGSQNAFATWSYIPVLSASTNSMYRSGAGVLNNEASLGHNGIRCSRKHHLCTGDYVIYTATSGAYVSRRVTVVSETTFTVAGDASITSSTNTAWYYVYLYSEADPGSDILNEVHLISYVKMPVTTESAVVIDLYGLASRQLFLQNLNFFNQPGSYYNQAMAADARVVTYCKTSTSYEHSREVPHSIDPGTVLEIELKPQPAPEVQVLAGFPVNGGLATETGRRPVVAVYQRGVSGQSQQVVFWGYYMRYSPESGTNYVQAINI